MVIKSLMNMKNVRLLGATVSSVFLLFSVSIPVNAATYTITFYERVGPTGPINLFDTTNYRVSGTGSFEINDAAVTPNNLVLFTDSNFLAFDAIISLMDAGGRFTLGTDDDFPPRGDGTGSNTHEQGILFDASGQPLRFDTPTTTLGNATVISSEENLDSRALARLTLWDDDLFDTVFLNDGTITTGTLATANSQAFTRLSGQWFFESDSFPRIGPAGSNHYYLIQAVPVPAAVWLFGSGLIGLIGVARRKK